ncbi:uncharacterized protein [Euphorbia lathyris]|uniref:uncharacterized protein isoform X1 n=1 Tax=Euphorbia lathyris TaxID=212925 RepID=UPI00331401B2
MKPSGFTRDDDVLLCSLYVEMMQDTINKRKKDKGNTWRRVETAYNAREQTKLKYRNWKSLECRYYKIEGAVKMLKGCLRQIEQMNPNGASDRDIMDQAKQLMKTDPKFKNGFKFDHVWSMLKDFSKYSDHVPKASPKKKMQNPSVSSLKSENPTSEFPVHKSPGLSDISIELNENNSTSRSSEKPIGVKKEKLKKKKGSPLEESMTKVKGNVKLCELLVEANAIERNAKLCELLAEANALSKKHLKIEEDKIMAMDINTIEDPLVRDYFRRRQFEIAKSKFEEDDGSDHLRHQGLFTPVVLEVPGMEN